MTGGTGCVFLATPASRIDRLGHHSGSRSSTTLARFAQVPSDSLHRASALEEWACKTPTQTPHRPFGPRMKMAMSAPLTARGRAVPRPVHTEARCRPGLGFRTKPGRVCEGPGLRFRPVQRWLMTDQFVRVVPAPLTGRLSGLLPSPPLGVPQSREEEDHRSEFMCVCACVTKGSSTVGRTSDDDSGIAWQGFPCSWRAGHLCRFAV